MDFCPCSQCNGKVKLCSRQVQRHLDDEAGFLQDGEAGKVRPGVEHKEKKGSHMDTRDDDGVAVAEVRDLPALAEKAAGEREGVPLFASSSLTVAQFSLLMLKIQNKHVLSEAAMADLCDAFKAVLPQPNNVQLFSSVKRFAEQLALPAVCFDVCPNDCVRFDAKLAAATSCPVCGSARRDENGKALKVFRSLPLIPQLQRLFESAEAAKAVAWATDHARDPREIRDITESPAFHDVFGDMLALDKRNLAFLASTDGVQPFDHSNFDIWPIFLKVLNVPPHLRNSQPNLVLVGIVPGPKAPKNLNPYLEPLVDELRVLDLDGKGAVCFDAAKDNEPFTLHARLGIVVTDYRGSAKVNCQKGSGATNGCMKCEEEGVDCGHKKVYVAFRRFLQRNHVFRRDRRQFGSEETRAAPPMRKVEDIRKAATLSDTAARVYGAKPNSVDDPSRLTAVTGYSQLHRLSYWNPVDMNPSELMHLLEDCGVRWLEILKGERGIAASRSDSKEAPLKLLEASRELVESRLESLQTPSDFGSNCSGLFKYTGQLRAHDWMLLFTVLGIYAFRGALPAHVLHLWCRFCEVFSLLTARTCRPSDLDAIQERVVECLCLAEIIFPNSEFTIIFHLLLHCVHYMKRWGPYTGMWMYDCERYVGRLARSITSRAKPVEMLTRCYRHFSLVESHKTDIDAALSTSVAGSRFIKRLGYIQPVPGADHWGERFHAHSLSLHGNSKLAQVTDEDIPYLQSLFRLLVPRYDQLCKIYEAEKKIALDAARESKRRLAFPSMAAWVPRSTSLSGDDRDLLWGPSQLVTKFSRATVGGVQFRSAEAEAKLKSRMSFFSFDSSPDGKRVFREFGRVRYFAEVTFAGERLPIARTDIFKEPTTGGAEVVSNHEVYCDDRPEVQFELPMVDTRRVVAERRFVLVADFGAKVILAPPDDRLQAPTSSRLTGKCYVLDAAACLKPVGAKADEGE